MIAQQLQAARAERLRQASSDPMRNLQRQLRSEQAVPMVPEHIPDEVLAYAGEGGLPDYAAAEIARGSR
jgi:hypothetical protein